NINDTPCICAQALRQYTCIKPCPHLCNLRSLAMRKAVSNVFYITMILVFLFVLVGVIIPEQFEVFTTNVNAFLSTSFGWYYVWLMSALVFMTIVIAISPYGKIKLGKKDDEPEFSIP